MLTHEIALASGSYLASTYANRHGLITGSTGSGKTQSMLRLVSEFHAAGVPCFVPDVKGDIIEATSSAMGAGVPVQALTPGDNFRMSLQRLGADLAARALSLSDAQQGLVETALARGVQAPSEILPLLLPSDGGKASVRALSRALDRVPSDYFGPDFFDVAKLLDADNPWTVLDARELVETGSLYAAVILHLLDELYTRLPEVGDRHKPVLAFFVDEAHLLFAECPNRLLTRLERIVRLIRSKGVSLWFISQSPRDIPDLILGQLANRIQHSLRAATPRDRKAVQVAVETMPPAPGVDMVKTIGTMGPGQALVSLIGWTGMPLATALIQVNAPAWRPGVPGVPLTITGAKPISLATAAVVPGRARSRFAAFWSAHAFQGACAVILVALLMAGGVMALSCLMLLAVTLGPFTRAMVGMFVRDIRAGVADYPGGQSATSTFSSARLMLTSCGHWQGPLSGPPVGLVA